MIKDAIAIVDGTARCHSAVDAAIGLAHRHHAELAISIFFEQVPVISAVDPMGYGMAIEANSELQEVELASIRGELADVELGVALTSACLDAAAFPDAACRQALAVDLALIGPPSSWCNIKARRHIVEELILRSGTPTLVYPSKWKPSLFTHAVLAWNCSPQASRAARALISLLEPGAAIDVLMVEEGELGEESASEAQRAMGDHLARYGFDVRIHRRTAGDRPVDEVLVDYTASRGSQLLAIGGFSHSRLREGLLGGVTRRLIDSASVPVLFAG
jgi:nucleotide-binding universal stress UspA family protein